MTAIAHFTQYKFIVLNGQTSTFEFHWVI